MPNRVHIYLFIPGTIVNLSAGKSRSAGCGESGGSVEGQQAPEGAQGQARAAGSAAEGAHTLNHFEPCRRWLQGHERLHLQRSHIAKLLARVQTGESNKHSPLRSFRTVTHNSGPLDKVVYVSCGIRKQVLVTPDGRHCWPAYCKSWACVRADNHKASRHNERHVVVAILQPDACPV